MSAGLARTDEPDNLRSKPTGDTTMTKTFERALSPIVVDSLDRNLRDELDAPGAQTFIAREFDGDYLTGNSLHIAYFADVGRAGLVYVGSGSSGVTAWTDCTSPEDALRRYLDNDMIA